MSKNDPAERAVRDIRRKTRKQYSAEEKIRIVVSGLRGEDSIAELCRREGIAESLYYSWSKEFLEAGKKRLSGDTARQASSGEVKDLRREMHDFKEALAEQVLENRLLKKSMIGDGGRRRMRYPASEKLEIIRLVERSPPAGPAHPGQAGHSGDHILQVVRSLPGLRRSRPWKTVPVVPAGSGTASPTMSAAGSSTWPSMSRSCRRGNWR